eukprot:3967373-Prymnesium_polylepis.1
MLQEHRSLAHPQPGWVLDPGQIDGAGKRGAAQIVASPRCPSQGPQRERPFVDDARASDRLVVGGDEPPTAKIVHHQAARFLLQPFAAQDPPCQLVKRRAVLHRGERTDDGRQVLDHRVVIAKGDELVHVQVGHPVAPGALRLVEGKLEQ